MYILRLKTWSTHTQARRMHALERRQRRGRHRRRTHFHGVWLWILTHPPAHTYTTAGMRVKSVRTLEMGMICTIAYSAGCVFVRLILHRLAVMSVCRFVCVWVCVCKKGLNEWKENTFLLQVRFVECVCLSVSFLHEMFFRCKRQAHRHSCSVSLIHIIFFISFWILQCGENIHFFSLVYHLLVVACVHSAKYFEPAKMGTYLNP